MTQLAGVYPPSPYPEPAPSSAVAWRCRIGGQSYSFVALRVYGHGWFVTGQVTDALSWDALCHHLPPEDGRFLVLGVIAQIAHPALNGAL